jgi:hypothetical protein
VRFNGSYKAVQQVLCQLGGRGGGEAVGGECRQSHGSNVRPYGEKMEQTDRQGDSTYSTSVASWVRAPWSGSAAV